MNAFSSSSPAIGPMAPAEHVNRRRAERSGARRAMMQSFPTDPQPHHGRRSAHPIRSARSVARSVDAGQAPHRGRDTLPGYELLKVSQGQAYAFDVVRGHCAEMYRAMGLGEIGHLLSCQRDGSLCEGDDPKLKFTRTQTLMQGAGHCDCRYTYDPPQDLSGA